MSAHRRAEPREPDFDERIMALIEAAYADEARADLAHLGRMAYDLFATVRPPEPMIPNLKPELFISFDRARALDAIVQSTLTRDPAERFVHARAFGDALSLAFGPYLVEVPLATEELILMGHRIGVPFPAVIALDGIHAIDLLIEDPNRRLVLRAGWEANNLLDALRDCRLRRAPILVDDDAARFPHPAMVPHRPIADGDVELLRFLSPDSAIDC